LFGGALTAPAPADNALKENLNVTDRRHREKNKKKNAKILNGAPVGTSSDCLLADECAIKKDNPPTCWFRE